jgi:hypothetical protein
VPAGGEAIDDRDDLWRRIKQWVDDKNLGRRRPTSANFGDSSDGSGMSVDLARLRGSIEEALHGHEDEGLVAFPAGMARALEQEVVHVPVIDNLAHCAVLGKKTPKVRSFLAKNCTVLRGE